MLTFDIPKALLETTLVQKNGPELIASHFVSLLLPKVTIYDLKIVESNVKILTRVHHTYPSDHVVYRLPEGDFEGYILTQIANNYGEFYLLGFLPKHKVTNVSKKQQTRFYKEELKAFGLWNSVKAKRRE